MPKREMFAGITASGRDFRRDASVTPEVATARKQYIGELAIEILRRVLTRRQGESSVPMVWDTLIFCRHATGTP